MIMLTAGGCPTCRERWLPGAEERLDLDFCVSAAAYGEGVHSTQGARRHTLHMHYSAGLDRSAQAGCCM